MTMTIETDPGWPTTMPLTVRHSQVVTDITRYRALVARISCLSQDRSDLKFASMRVCRTVGAGHGMRQENWQVPRRQAKSEVLFRWQY